MKLTEAIKSGLPFKRPGDHTYGNNPHSCTNGHAGLMSFVFNGCDVVAEDWEIVEPKKEVTLSKLKAAWDESVEDPVARFEASRHSSTFQKLAKALGLWNG